MPANSETSLERARAVIAYDDVVDKHFDRAKRQLIGCLGRPGADGEYALDLLMIAKYFGRNRRPRHEHSRLGGVLNPRASRGQARGVRGALRFNFG